MTDHARKLISVVVPMHNEAGNIGRLHDALTSVLSALPAFDYEIVCVDDGSRDGTLDALLAKAVRDPHVRVVELSRNFGKEAALTAGMDQARGDAVIPLDADLQDPPELIAELIAQWQGGHDVVLARRVDRHVDSFFKRKTAEVFYAIHNSISPLKIPSNVGDFRLMDRCVVDVIKSLPERQRFMKGLFAWAGFRTAVVDYTRAPRLRGESSFSGWRLWNFAIEGITSFSTAPLRIWTYLGGIGALLTFLYATLIVIRTLVYGADVPGYASLLVAVLFYGSLQLIGIGVLGEYIGRIYMEAKQRPSYVIRKLHGVERAGGSTQE